MSALPVRVPGGYGFAETKVTGFGVAVGATGVGDTSTLTAVVVGVGGLVSLPEHADRTRPKLTNAAQSAFEGFIDPNGTSSRSRSRTPCLVL